MGGLIFIVKYNAAFLRPPIPRNTMGPVTKSKSEKVKYVDDGSVAVSINLKTCLVPDPVVRPKPLNYHERTCQTLPVENNLLQYYLDDTEKFAVENKMKINPRKTKVISFNKSRKFDFPPEVSMSGNQILEVVSEIKLVGVIINHDLRWQKNTNYICQKASEKLWTLRRLQKFSLDTFQIFDVYVKEVRSLLEYAVPVWHSGLTKKQTNQIEKIQKIAFKIILGDDYISYDVACTLLGVEPLELRRTQLCFIFPRKILKRRIQSSRNLEKCHKLDKQTRSRKLFAELTDIRTVAYHTFLNY